MHFGTMTGKFDTEGDKPITSRRVFRPESHLDHCFDYLRQVWHLNLVIIHPIADYETKGNYVCGGFGT